MVKHDFTVIYLTNNELPQEWCEYQQSVFLNAIDGADLITVSRTPMNLPGLNLIQTEPKSASNVYWQMLKAAKLVKTKYIIIAEDDTLYSSEHFTFFRPKDDAFGYNRNRASLFTWGEPMFHWRNRLTNCALIAPTGLLIEALEERFAKHHILPEDRAGELGRGMVDRNLGVKVRKCEEQYSKTCIIQLNHAYGLEERQRTQKKSYGQIKAYDIPYWGRADDLVKKFPI